MNHAIRSFDVGLSYFRIVDSYSVRRFHFDRTALIEGDLHELPVQLARMILESEGGEVQSLGPNTPLFALSELVTRQRPQLVCIAARSISDLDRATAEYSQLRKITGKLGVSVVIGGEGFRDPGFRERFPSEFYADNFAGFSKFIRALIKRGEGA